MMAHRVNRLLTEDEGVTAIEYGLIGLLVGVAIVAALMILGPAVGNMFDYVAGAVNNHAP